MRSAGSRAVVGFAVSLFEQFSTFFSAMAGLLGDPANIVVLMLASFMGIVFGALPGLTATLGVALLTTLTYGMPLGTALIALLAMYVGAIYGGSYPAILINIPGTAASAATAMDGYPIAQRGEGGRALGLTTTASFLGTIIGMLCLVAFAPLIAELALQFTSYEFFLLAFFGIVISGTLTSTDLVYKGWIAGLLGLALSTVGRDHLQFYPRYTFDIPALDGGIEVVPVLIGAFGIPQIIKVLRDRLSMGKPAEVGRDPARVPHHRAERQAHRSFLADRRRHRRGARRRRGYRRLGVLRHRARTPPSIPKPSARANRRGWCRRKPPTTRASAAR